MLVNNNELDSSKILPTQTMARLDKIPDGQIEEFCACAKVDRTRLVAYLIKLCECGAFNGPEADQASTEVSDPKPKIYNQNGPDLLS
ncbi:hypothetical protein TWF718_003838 [Orbilia javanica]|uniref:Uncharacterized protein n=1 Tax=Orbilia javanica TaxID=47235 RepID=A0AAN8RF43_9PEZI